MKQLLLIYLCPVKLTSRRRMHAFLFISKALFFSISFFLITLTSVSALYRSSALHLNSSFPTIFLVWIFTPNGLDAFESMTSLFISSLALFCKNKIHSLKSVNSTLSIDNVSEYQMQAKSMPLPIMQHIWWQNIFLDDNVSLVKFDLSFSCQWSYPLTYLLASIFILYTITSTFKYMFMVIVNCWPIQL